MAEGGVPANILDGIVSELDAEVRYVKGDAKNHTKECDITFVILPLGDQTADPVFKATLAPGETVHFKLKPGDYVMVALYTKDGVFDGVVENPFRILDVPEPFGFDFRQGVPPVKA
jgi:hypothetical protein